MYVSLIKLIFLLTTHCLRSNVRSFHSTMSDVLWVRLSAVTFCICLSLSSHVVSAAGVGEREQHSLAQRSDAGTSKGADPISKRDAAEAFKTFDASVRFFFDHAGLEALKKEEIKRKKRIKYWQDVYKYMGQGGEI
ncbi:uncharacterized protein LOC131928130 [Physella acuta]|uniref:uncharacterized protein LOC131928130 n=1 Tax=Physella acuta TaxID=109671 RepID=UPI0027DCFC86|nr:uncharacterized protein LOC131928130 [Physella acuta]